MSTNLDGVDALAKELRSRGADIGQMIYCGSNGRAEIDTTVLTRIIRRSNTGNRHVTKR